MNPRELRIADYSYLLPDECIADQPTADRDKSHLLVWKAGSIRDKVFQQLPEELGPEHHLVFNTTRVIPARIHFTRSTGALIEILCLHPANGYQEGGTSMEQRTEATWYVLVGNIKRWKNGPLVIEAECLGKQFILTATLLSRSDDLSLVSFSWSPGELTFGQVLDAVGQVPLPPYFHRPPGASDRERYQTILGRIPGSVAAPTASLHFTQKVMDALAKRGITSSRLTLHVGAGTFRPVTAAHLGDHLMHEEYFEMPVQELITLRQSLSKKIIPVGTTALRTLETLYWLGVKRITGDSDSENRLGQWEAYELPDSYSATQSLDALITWCTLRKLTLIHGYTALMIAPGYRFHMSAGLITNFHQPSSTLILLVAALAGEKWSEIYSHALNHGYRFLSYGDSSLLLPEAHL